MMKHEGPSCVSYISLRSTIDMGIYTYAKTVLPTPPVAFVNHRFFQLRGTPLKMRILESYLGQQLGE